MTPEEQQAIDDLNNAVATEKLNAWARLALLADMPPDQLASCGYRNGTAEAVLDSFKRSQTTVRKLHKAFLAKYPD